MAGDVILYSIQDLKSCRSASTSPSTKTSMSASNASYRPRGLVGSSMRRFELVFDRLAKSWMTPTRRLRASDGDGQRLASGGPPTSKVGPNESIAPTWRRVLGQP